MLTPSPATCAGTVEAPPGKTQTPYSAPAAGSQLRFLAPSAPCAQVRENVTAHRCLALNAGSSRRLSDTMAARRRACCAAKSVARGSTDRRVPPRGKTRGQLTTLSRDRVRDPLDQFGRLMPSSLCPQAPQLVSCAQARYLFASNLEPSDAQGMVKRPKSGLSRPPAPRPPAPKGSDSASGSEQPVPG